MKKNVLSFVIVLCSHLVFSQVGIGTPSPRGALDINKPTTNNMGLVLPTNADVNNIINPMGGNVVPGTIIYDSAKDCVRVYKATNVWSDCFCQCPAGSGFTLDCTGAAHNGTLISGTTASGASSVISYTGGNGSAYTAQSIPSTGVTGLTATLNAGNFANGNGSLTYTITGAPSAAGTAIFAINIGGQACTLTRTVNASGGTITSLNCSGATNNGTLTSGSPASGVSSVISYTGGNGGSYTAQNVVSTGVTGLTATLNAGSFANGNGSVTYTITGTPSSSGTASFTINIGGQTCTLTRTVNSPTPPPSPNLTNTCTGWMLDYGPGPNSTINGTVNGLPVTATYSGQDWVQWGSNQLTSCNVPFNPEYNFEFGSYAPNASADNAFMRIKFNRQISNFKVYEGGTNTNEVYSYVMKRNGVVVTPTLIVGSGSSCTSRFTVGTNSVTCNSPAWDSFAGTASSIVYNFGGVWFDEIEISGSTLKNTGGSVFNFCVGSAQ